MSKFRKVITMDAPADSTAERLNQRLEQVSQQGHGSSMINMRAWLQTGFLFSELGHGVMESWLAMDREGRFGHMTAREKADWLVNQLQNVSWQEENRQPTKTVPPITPAPAPEPAPEPAPANVSVSETAPKKSERRLKRHLA